MDRFTLMLEGWRSTSKPVEVSELVRAFKWPTGLYQEMEDMEASVSPRGYPGNLHLTLASATKRGRWKKELARLAQWLDEQPTDLVLRAASSRLRLGVVVDVWSSVGQPNIALGTSVLAAAARLKLPIRLALHIGE